MTKFAREEDNHCWKLVSLMLESEKTVIQRIVVLY